MVTADYLTVGASGGTVFVGMGGGTANPTGFNANLNEFALAVITEQGGSNRTWHAMTGTLNSASFSGIEGLTIQATHFELQVNTAASDGRVLDFGPAGSRLTVNTGGANSLDIAFDGNAGELLHLSGNVALDVFGFVVAVGTFEMVKQDVYEIDDPDHAGTLSMAGSLLTVDISLDALFVGSGAVLNDGKLDTSTGVGFVARGGE